MRVTWMRGGTALAAAAVVGLALAGCGGGGSGSTSGGGTPTGASPASTVQGVSTPSSVSVVTATNAN